MTAEQTSAVVETDGDEVVESSVGESAHQRGTETTARHGTARPFLRTARYVLVAFAVVGAGSGLAAALNGTVSVVGFYLLAALALSLMFSVVSQYAPVEAADAAASGAGSSGGGGPFTFDDFRPTLVEVGIPTGVVVAVTGYVGSWLAE